MATPDPFCFNHFFAFQYESPSLVDCAYHARYNSNKPIIFGDKICPRVANPAPKY
jgi:hypothetical protein